VAQIFANNYPATFEGTTGSTLEDYYRLAKVFGSK
jgi:hypothetical protein